MGMKQTERDELLVRQTEALESTAHFSMRFAQALEEPGKKQRERELYAGIPPAFDFLAGGRGVRTLLQTIPGFAGLWEKQVPEAYLEVQAGLDASLTTIVHCTCGALTVLPVTGVAQCSGGRFMADGELLDPAFCCRFFFALSHADVRVRLFPGAGE